MSASPQTTPFSPNTCWVWSGESHSNQHLWLRRTFSLHSLPESARLRITVNDRYTLYLNGRRVGQGPVPHREPWVPLDSLDLLPHLVTGTNTLAIDAHFLGIAHHSNSSTKPGVIAELELRYPGDRVETLSTDSAWKTHPALPWSTTANRRRSWATGFSEDFNARRDLPDWNQPDSDDTCWPNAISTPVSAATLFFARTTPLIEETFLPARTLLNGWTAGTDSFPPEGTCPTIRLDTEPLAPLTESVLAPIRASVEARKPFTIPADSDHALALTFDLGEEWSGSIEFELDAPEGCLIEGVGAERLTNNRPQAAFKGADYAFRYTTRDGLQTWREENYNGARWLHLVFRQRPDPIHIKRIGFVRRQSALPLRSTFECSDPLWNRLDAVSRHTLAICSQETQVDCPTREQAPYIGDAIWTGLWAAWISGDACYLRQLLFLARTGQMENGLMTGAVLTGLGPSHTLLDYCLLYTWGLWQLYFHTGDPAEIVDGLPASERMLRWFINQLDADGFLALDAAEFQKAGKGVLFIDHNGLGWHLRGDPGIDRRGRNAGLHFLLLQSLDYHLQLCRAAGVPCGLAVDEKRLTELRTHYRNAFWNPQTRFFADAIVEGKLSPSLSEQTQVLAVLCGVTDPGESADLLRRILAYNERPIARSTTYFIIYLAEAMLRCGLRRELYDLVVERWKPMLDAGATTWWETFLGDELDSYCHPWSSAPLWLSLRLVLGIEPTSPGWKTATVNPLHHLIASGRGSVCTPHGEITVSWEPGAPPRIDAPDAISLSSDAA